VLRHLPPVVDPNVLVGAMTSDDAAVYKLADDLALVATVDYITPVVDDPFAWGGVAAANALSDVYAMGARPIFALNVVNFPRDTLPLDVLERVVQGGAAKASEAGVAILGGHSVDDPEPKYGLVALGLVHPARVIRNVGARPDDALILTKPLGIGVITTAIKRGLASPEVVEEAVQVMLTLNRAASEAMVAAQGSSHTAQGSLAADPDVVRAATDVTGFGLLGHLAEMLGGGEVGARVDAESVPVLEAAWEFAAHDVVPGGTRRNLASVASSVDWSERLTEPQRLVLGDAQTSGGLLIAVDPAAADALLSDLHARGVKWACQIGVFTDAAGRIQIA
jgi:selenium donor protein